MRQLLGYCTNVHAGVTLDEIKANLERYAVAVRQHLGWQSTLGVGLWIPAKAAEELTDVPRAIESFSQWLQEKNLEPYTINGFPFENFHTPVVKHRVYLPTWWQTERRIYTSQLIEILDGLLPPGKVGSISTLPIAWGKPTPSHSQLEAVVEALTATCEQLQHLEEASGRRIVLAIEPEPGCYLGRTDELIEFFDCHFPHPIQRRYLTVCHDICHASVMNETQADSLAQLRDAGLTIGKVQVSAAIEVDWRACREYGHPASVMIDQLRGFAEDRYLHQTGCVDQDGSFELVEDLPQLLAEGPKETTEKWRIHFHMPIHLRQFGHLATTQADILDCFKVLTSSAGPAWTGHFEVETYAWSVLPASLQPKDLSVGIAAELAWLSHTLKEELI